MAYQVTTFNDEAELAAYVSPGTVTTYKSEQELGIALDGLTVETITVLVTKGIYFTLVIDGDFGANTLIAIVAKGIKFTVIEETP